MISAIDIAGRSHRCLHARERLHSFPGTLARIPIVPSDVPYTVGDTYARTTIGTGPYRFVEWTQGDQIVLRQFEGYWDERASSDRSRW